MNKTGLEWGKFLWKELILNSLFIFRTLHSFQSGSLLSFELANIFWLYPDTMFDGQSALKLPKLLLCMCLKQTRSLDLTHYGNCTLTSFLGPLMGCLSLQTFGCHTWQGEARCELKEIKNPNGPQSRFYDVKYICVSKKRQPVVRLFFSGEKSSEITLSGPPIHVLLETKLGYDWWMPGASNDKCHMTCCCAAVATCCRLQASL